MHSGCVSQQRPPTFSHFSGWSGGRLGLVTAGLLTLTMALLVFVQPAAAQSPASPGADPAAESLTQDLVALHALYRQAGAAEQARHLRHLRSTAAARQQLLAALIEYNPGEVLRVALPADLRASLPPAVQTYVEEAVAVEGELEVLHEDRNRASRYLYFLHAAGQRLALHFAAEPPDAVSGTPVRVSGLRLGQALALESGSTSLQPLAAVVPNTFGAQKTLVILVNFQDKATQPYTLATAQNVVFSQTSNFDLENSYGQTWLTGDVVGWYTLPLSSTVCDYSSLASYAKQAATAAGVNLSLYSRYVYAFPKNACTWWGLGSVGGNPSQAWINGSIALKVVGHEMGHNFGLYHSHSLDCGTTVLGSSCTSSDYGDTIDIMGNPAAGHFNAFQKEHLGWLDYGASPALTTVQTDGLYTLEPLAAAGTGPKGLAVLKSTNTATGQQTWYYVEYRRATGFDSFLSTNSNVINGVVVHTGSPSSGNSSYLLDMTPATSSWSDPALGVGQSFSDAESGVTITPVSVSSTAAVVAVSFGPLACVRANPTVALSPSQSQWVSPGTPVTYTVAVTNRDNAGCAAATFALQAAVPAGWTAAFANQTLDLSPGASASTTLQVTAPAAEVEGFYNLGVTATNSADAAYTASAAATVVLVSDLDVSLSTNQSSYTRTQSVVITAVVRANGAPVANASVTFTVTKANGTTVQQTVTTNTSGSAGYTLRLKKPDPLGTYQVSANATVNGISGSGVASFAVTK
jgi:NPCBM-associated, NEW3 domain of alpha-galactosidase